MGGGRWTMRGITGGGERTGCQGLDIARAKGCWRGAMRTQAGDGDGGEVKRVISIEREGYCDSGAPRDGRWSGGQSRADVAFGDGGGFL